MYGYALYAYNASRVVDNKYHNPPTCLCLNWANDCVSEQDILLLCCAMRAMWMHETNVLARQCWRRAKPRDGGWQLSRPSRSAQNVAVLSLLVIASLINLINPTQLERDADLVIVMFDILQAHEHCLLQKKSYSQCNTQNLTNILILRTVHQTFPVLTADLRHIFARGWHETKAPGRLLAAPWPSAPAYLQ